MNKPGDKPVHPSLFVPHSFISNNEHRFSGQTILCTHAHSFVSCFLFLVTHFSLLFPFHLLQPSCSFLRRSEYCLMDKEAR